MQSLSALFQPYTFRIGIQVGNRLVLAPMTTWSSDPDGSVSQAELDYIARRSTGVGPALTAVTYVTPNGKGFHGEFAAEHDYRLESLKSLAQAIKSGGARAVLQIFHADHQALPDLVGNDVVSASDVPPPASPFRSDIPVPVRSLSRVEIQDIEVDFGQTTRRAIEAGFDGVEIQGANGYLIQQFLSGHSNRRTEEWGGSLENRLRFPLAVIEEVKRVVVADAQSRFWWDTAFLLRHLTSRASPCMTP